MKHLIYTDRLEFINHDTFSWFDAIVVHRCPPPHVLAVLQKAKLAGKVIVYEWDDDLFNIPDWNPNYARYDENVLERARVAMRLGDFVVGSTEMLCEIAEGDGEKVEGPNLIELTEYKEGLLKRTRQVVPEHMHIRPCPDVEKTGMFFNIHTQKKVHYNQIKDHINPIRILWTGSNTHDQDLQEVIDAVVSTGNEYGMAVTFCFFGYCPEKFSIALVQAGNTKPEIVVAEEWRWLIRYIKGVKFTDYVPMLRKIDADFAICPLSQSPFNLSKSNIKVLEMGALGIPCIATNYGPYQFIKHRQDGLLVEPGDKKGWVESIRELILNVNYRIELGNNMADRVNLDYSWNATCPNVGKWEYLFQRIHETVQERRDKFFQEAPHLKPPVKVLSDQT